MQNLIQPTLLLKPFAQSGDKNDIPVVNNNLSNPQLADLTNGFPDITSRPPAQGGLPPERKDFNALGYLTTTYDYFYQAGGTFTFNQVISDAIGGYPLNARLWYTDSNGVSCVLRSTIANNTNNFLTDSSVIGETDSGKPWEVENFKGVTVKGFTLFETKWSDHIINDVSWLRADTFSWQDGTVYSDAYNHLVDDYNTTTSQWTTEQIGSYTIWYIQANDGHKIVFPENEAVVNSIYNETGVAWYYILDRENQRFKLPRTKYGFTGLRDIVGKYVDAGLPNITGRYSITYARQNESSASGALYASSETQTCYNGANNQRTGPLYFRFDASRSSAVYGKSTTVQPKATQMYLYFYVGNYSSTAIEQTAGLNTELFNGKVDLPTGKSQADIDFVVSSYKSGSSWYRVYKSGWVEQGGAFSSSSTEQSKSVTLLKTMADSNYFVSLQRIRDAYDASATTPLVRTKGTASFTCYGLITNTCWMVVGKGA